MQYGVFVSYDGVVNDPEPLFKGTFKQCLSYISAYVQPIDWKFELIVLRRAHQFAKWDFFSYAQ